jgi:UrcA family protein
MNKTVLIAAALLAGLPALAHAETRSEVIRLADLDLSSSAGQAAMLSRISGAAGRVCGGRPQVGPIEIHRRAKTSWTACKAAATSRAVAEVEAGRARVYAARAPR